MHKLLFSFILLVAGIAGTAFGQAPAVAPGGIVNHFSYASPGLPNADIAQGSIFDIYGTNIGPATLQSFSGFPIPTVIANTSVQVTVAGTTVNVYLFFVSSGQIVGVLPSTTPIGTGTLTVTVNGQQSAPAPIRVVARSIGILSLNQAGHGAAAMQMPDGVTLPPPLNSVSAPIKPLGLGVFYGTGAGAVTFDESNGAPFMDLGDGIEALVGGKVARMTFKGRTPGLVGLDQFNVEIPADVSGCYVPVAFRTGNVISNYTTISVAPDGACPDPRPDTPLPTSGFQKVGAVRLVRSMFQVNDGQNWIDFTSDGASSSFSSTDFSKVTPGPGSIFTQIGPCVVQTAKQPEQPDNTDSVSYLDAGTLINVNGPGGARQLARTQVAGVIAYSAMLGSTPFPGAPPPQPPPPYLVAGAYTTDNGAGGSQVGPFQASLTMPQDFVWTNANIQTVTRSQGLEIIWQGGDPNSTVEIAGSSTVPASGSQPDDVMGYFSCSLPASQLRYTVPPEVLLTLPPSAIEDGIPRGGITVGHTGVPVRFNATGIDYGEFSFTTSVSRTVQYQ